ncbi:hypothetical protein SHKM778_89490 [Streptomyces sp. KM77-8]|uniref:Transposase IS30-like HTH domain-containing protein n=1 Tax=Streptomyces haneummycinicus TaxID=3074435 RepID=A0AAT9HYS9_9ACTN
MNAILTASRTLKETALPGGRLTQQERQQIALGLADGLAYAEIARRLDRPTSTVTREVIRNGGPTAYRADLAHRATERRAHRRKRAALRGRMRRWTSTDGTRRPCASTRRRSPPSSSRRARPG